jgi:hypothetical protein
MWVVWFAMQHHKAFDFSRGLFTLIWENKKAALNCLHFFKILLQLGFKEKRGNFHSL